MSSQAGISSGRAVSSASAGMTPSSFCRAKRLLAQRVPALVELALVLGRPLGGHVVRRVRRARRVVDEERLVGHQRLLLAHPVDRVVGHVLGEVVALLRRAVGLDRDGVLVDRRRVLVRLAADEAVEVLEAAAAGGPGVERPHRARLPHRHLVALAELRRRVAVELQRLGQRRRRVRAHRVVAGRRGRDLGDAAHADRVVVAAGEQRLPRRRAERRRVEAVVLQPVRRQPLGGRRLARPAEGARGSEAGVVEQDDEHVRRAGRRPQRLDRRERRVRVLRVVRGQPDVRAVGIGRTAREGRGTLSILGAAPRVGGSADARPGAGRVKPEPHGVREVSETSLTPHPSEQGFAKRTWPFCGSAFHAVSDDSRRVSETGRRA